MGRLSPTLGPRGSRSSRVRCTLICPAVHPPYARARAVSSRCMHRSVAPPAERLQFVQPLPPPMRIAEMMDLVGRAAAPLAQAPSARHHRRALPRPRLRLKIHAMQGEPAASAYPHPVAYHAPLQFAMHMPNPVQDTHPWRLRRPACYSRKQGKGCMNPWNHVLLRGWWPRGSRGPTGERALAHMGPPTLRVTRTHHPTRRVGCYPCVRGHACVVTHT